MRTSELSFRASDGFELQATEFLPAELADVSRQTGAPRGAVLICSATAVRRGYYRHFASFLAEKGWVVLTFDYRGVGESRPDSLRGFAARMDDWALLDSSAALATLRDRHPGLGVWFVGHSFGGQALPLVSAAPTLRGALFVAVQSGSWQLWNGPSRYGIWALWHLVIPLLTGVFGYLPGKAMGQSEDLPKGVARQWAHWGRSSRYLLRDGGKERLRRYRELALPILAFSFTDDPYAPSRAARGWLDEFAAATIEHQHLEPSAIGVERIGHFGFFRKQFRHSLWETALAWLNLPVDG